MEDTDSPSPEELELSPEDSPEFNLEASPEGDEYIPQTEKPKRKSAAGRELVRWDPDKDQLVLLCVDHICGTQGIVIPWDKVAEHFGELMGKHNISGEAIKQHLSKVYKSRTDRELAVPPKMERNQRRKALDLVEDAGGPPPQTRGRGKRGTANNARDDEEQVDATPVKRPGSGLLYIKPPKARNVKVKAVTAKTPARGGRRKKGDGVDDATSVLDIKDGDEDGDFGKEKKQTAVSRGSKRGRNKSSVFANEPDNDMGMEVPTPTKKPKINLRTSQVKNYREPTEHDGAEATPNFNGLAGLGQQQYRRLNGTIPSYAELTFADSSQGSSLYIQAMPSGTSIFDTPSKNVGGHGTPQSKRLSILTPFQAGLTFADLSQGRSLYTQALPSGTSLFDRPFQNYSQVTTPGYSYHQSGNTTPYAQSDSRIYNGMGGFKFAGLPPPQMRAYNGYEYLPAASMSRGYTGMMDSDNSLGSGAAGINHTYQAQVSDAMHTVADSRMNNSLAGAEEPRRDSFQHDQAAVNKTDKDLQLPHNGHLHLHTRFEGPGDVFNTSGMTVTPTSISPAETGMTPAMAQTGFMPLAPLHEDSLDSFDSGYNGYNGFEAPGNITSEGDHSGQDVDYTPHSDGQQFPFGYDSFDPPLDFE
ncbi:hypothetical protein LTR48_001980 [Friedmanniomyces endolithicus]|uniref:TEA domain-containing protein n=1 Tax=Rachicladosporium monterosium TaxID=1507873 RepID=A0ABR0LC70_9PEZI|nr:hypothetical protein LTR29_000809 [Friedmanniomyces endolithicus]KAK1093608.1 hypothetical protein LTR48_001980 [Friedmanniomyces endolithicus]KAK5146653.1 hypothetical protein LTR32_001787 [Rachicladosporium monterosium]